MGYLIFYIPDILKKMGGLNAAIEEALSLSKRHLIDQPIARDVPLLKACDLPVKLKLSTAEGQARLIHDLANIELQAMELALRTLYEYPESPLDFRRELAEIARSEAFHLKLCLETLKTLNFTWGHWPIHLALWQSVSAQDSLIERIFIVHRYLEASGLDAGAAILSRLSGVSDKRCLKTIGQIVKDEIEHVDFGSKWFRYFCLADSKNPDSEFSVLLEKFSKMIPRKERPSYELRRRAGFSEYELKFFT